MRPRRVTRLPYEHDGIKMNIEIGVLGLGRMGFEHCREISATPGLKLVAASSRSTEARHRAGEQFPITTYSSHEELIEKTTAPWIVIATFTREHARWALQGISRGKNLIIEKPVTLNYEEAEKVFQEAENRCVAVTVHQNLRWDRDFTLVRIDRCCEGILAPLGSGTFGNLKSYRSIERRRCTWYLLPKNVLLSVGYSFAESGLVRKVQDDDNA